MEDSTSNTLQEIEKLKQKISGYRDALMTLKMGNSIEDYLIMKREFDVLKTQISYIENLTKKMDEKQHTQNEKYEEQVKQLAIQLAGLNQTTEEMYQEILSISNKLIISKSEEIPENNTTTIMEETHAKKSHSILTPINDITPTNTQSSTVSNQPSYMELRNLARQVLQPQKEQENIAPNGHKGNQKDQRYFNQRYFQSINTHPNNIYNGLYKNTLGKNPLNFKNSTENQNTPTNDGDSYHSSRITNEPEKTNESPSINNINENVNTSAFNTVEPNSENVMVSITNETNHNDSLMEEQDQFLPVMPIEKINKHAESSEVESKKQKNSSIFNIFRK